MRKVISQLSLASSRNFSTSKRLLSSLFASSSSRPSQSSSSASASSSSLDYDNNETTNKEHKLKDYLENIIRESNASFPNLEGKVVQGIVTKIDSRNGFVDVDVGFKMPSSFVSAELPEDVKLGDRVPLRVKRLQNPFGEMDVDSSSVDQFRKHQLAWDAIAQKREKRELVTGRVLNAVNGGFAVGVAGHVGFLPKKLARDEKGRRLVLDRDSTPPIGEAMKFRVLSMSESGGARNFVVSGPELEERERAPREKFVSRPPRDRPTTNERRPPKQKSWG
jgi:ribosomal protein S1